MRNDVYLENRVLAADGIELIHLLYEHAIVQVKTARTALTEDDVVNRAKAISKVLGILGELEGSLNHNEGGTISYNLGRLYQYMRRRIVEGNVKRQDAALAEVEALLRTLDEGWTAIRHRVPSHPQWQTGAEAGAFLPQGQAEEDPANHSWSA